MKTMNIGNGKAVLMEDDVYESIKRRGGSIYQGSGAHNNYIYINWNKVKSESLARFTLGLTQYDNTLIVYHKDGDIYNCLRENIYSDKKTKMYNDRGPTAGRKYKGISVRDNGKKFYVTLPFEEGKIYNSIPFTDDALAAMQYDSVLDFVNRPGYRNFSEEKIDILPELKEHLVKWMTKHNIEVNYNE